MSPTPCAIGRDRRGRTKQEPFKAHVLERIEAARPHWIPAAVLHRELRGLRQRRFK